MTETSAVPTRKTYQLLPGVKGLRNEGLALEVEESMDHGRLEALLPEPQPVRFHVVILRIHVVRTKPINRLSKAESPHHLSATVCQRFG